MPRYGRFDAKFIFFFLTSGGVLRGSEGAIHVPELEKYEAGYKIFDQKSRFFYGNVPPTDIFQISIEKSTFSVENFVFRNTALGLWDIYSSSESLSTSSFLVKKKIASARPYRGISKRQLLFEI